MCIDVCMDTFAEACQTPSCPSGTHLVMAYVVMAYVVMADVVMAYVDMAYVVMADACQTPSCPSGTHRLYTGMCLDRSIDVRIDMRIAKCV